MADINIQHKDVGQQLSKTEWEAADSHVVIHSIADNAVVTVDGDPADNEFARWTASGLEGRTVAETLSDLGITDTMVYKGVIDCSTTPDYPAADAGHLYVVSVAGKIGGSSGVTVEAGDTAICKTDGTVSGNQATVGAYWNIIQVNIDGAVIGPASAVGDNFVSFNSTTGKLIKDSGSKVADFATAAHKTQHAVSGTDTVFPADPNADKYLMWDDDPGALVWGTPAGTYTHPNHSGDVTSIGDGAQALVNKQSVTFTAPLATTQAISVVAAAAPTISIPAATAAQNGYATSTQITKLAGIEALADVTDATNVAAAGALMAVPKLDDCAAPDVNTDLDASSTKHGLCPKGSGVATEFLNGNLGFSTPAGGGGAGGVLAWLGL